MAVSVPCWLLASLPAHIPTMLHKQEKNSFSRDHSSVSEEAADAFAQFGMQLSLCLPFWALCTTSLKPATEVERTV